MKGKLDCTRLFLRSREKKKALHILSRTGLFMDWHRKIRLTVSERMFMTIVIIDGVRNMQNFGKKNFQCINCIESKGRRAIIFQQACRRTRQVELTYTNMIGKIDIPSLGGALYFVLFLDTCKAMTSVLIILARLNSCNACEPTRIWPRTSPGTK